MDSSDDDDFKDTKESITNKQLFFSVLIALAITILIMFAFQYFELTSDEGDGMEHTVLIDKEQQEVSKILGVDLKTIDAKTAKRLKIHGGVKVLNLHTGRLKKHTEIRVGFIITKVNGQEIKSTDDLMSILENKQGKVMLEGIYEHFSGVTYYSFDL